MLTWREQSAHNLGIEQGILELWRDCDNFLKNSSCVSLKQKYIIEFSTRDVTAISYLYSRLPTGKSTSMMKHFFVSIYINLKKPYWNYHKTIQLNLMI